MARVLTVCSALLALSTWVSQAAADSVCAQIEDRDVRLRCYDAEYRATPPDESATAAQETSGQSAEPTAGDDTQVAAVSYTHLTLPTSG